MQRNLSYALAACAVYFAVSYGFQHWLKPHSPFRRETSNTTLPWTKMTFSDLQNQHITIYSVEAENPKTHETIPLGKLTKTEEWWITPTARRQDTVSWDALQKWAKGDRSAPLPRAWVIWKNRNRTAYDPQTHGILQTTEPERNPRDWKNYSLEAIVGTEGRAVIEEGLSAISHDTVHINTHTITLQNPHSPNEPRWVCQMDATTGLPIRIDETHKRDGKWVTTTRYDFAFERPFPVALFDANKILDPAPADFAAPDFPGDETAPEAALAAEMRRTEHVACYRLEGGFPNGTLTKVEEWWKQGDLLRQETPLNSDLTEFDGRGVVSAARHWRTIYQGKKQWQYSPEDRQVRAYPETTGPENVMCGLKGYKLEQIIDDGKPDMEAWRVYEDEPQMDGGELIMTRIAEPNGSPNGPRWVYRFRPGTALPIQVDQQKKRNNEWITTLRYRFEFTRPYPRDLFDGNKLQNPPLPDATFPATE